MSSELRSLRVVIPAAGIGRRMASDVPKQYLALAGGTVLDWSIAPFLARTDVAGVVVVLSSEDHRFASLKVARDARVRTALGGAERAESVAQGLKALGASDDDWVLVHDAVRPCLHPKDLAHLVDSLIGDDVGGILATPVADTLKSADSAQRIQATVPRTMLWRALTPQMFRYGVLHEALRAAAAKRIAVTDEASAIEALGLKPKLVAGRSDNIKITVPEDLAYAEHILRSRSQ